MKRVQLFLLFLCLFVSHLSAQTAVYCPEAGIFSSTIAALNINKDTITYLKVGGVIDARDFKEIKYFSKLKSIDMSKVTINAYTGLDGTANAKFVDDVEVPTIYLANEIPEYGISGGVERFVFPYSIKKVGDYLFSNHGIKEVVFPPKLDSVGKYAFAECVYLKKVVIPANSTPSSLSISFAACTAVPASKPPS